MTDTEKNEIMKSSIVAAVKNHKICNMTQLAVSMGLLKKGQSVSGSFGKKVRSLVPEIADLFKANGTNGEKETTTPIKPTKPAKPVKEPKTTKEPKAEKVAKVVSESKATKTPKTVKVPKAPKTTSPGSSSLYPRHAQNPFRVGSSYGRCLDCFASFKNGVRRDELLTKVAEAVGKDLKHAAYDLAVILSAKESNVGPRHRSCPEGFWVRRENDNLCLVIDN